MAVLELRGVGRTYPGPPEVRALDDVTLTVEQGEFVAITGPSGSGKSTLLNTLALLDAPTSGEYLVDGVSTSGMKDRRRAQLRASGFAFVFQSFHLLPARTVLQNVMLGSLYQAPTRAVSRRRALAALDKVGLADKATQLAGTLSGGECQRVAIARAIAGGATVIIADEPTGNLDSRNSAAVVQLFQGLHSSGRTIILVTHEDDVARVAGRQVAMRDGGIASDTSHNPTQAPGWDSASKPLEPSPPTPGEPQAEGTQPNPPAGVGNLHASQLKLRDLLSDAWASVTSRPSRSLMLAGAIAVGVGLAVATMGLAVTTSGQVSDQFDAARNRQVVITGPAEITAQQAASMARPDTVAALQDLAGVDHAGEVWSGDRVKVARTGAAQPVEALLVGVSADLPAAADARIRWADGRSEGSQMTDADVVVGAKLAADIALGPLAAGPVVWVDGVPRLVTGIVESSPRAVDLLQALTLPLTQAQQLSPNAYVSAYLRTAPGAAHQVAAQAPLVMYPQDPDSFTIDAPPDPTTLRRQVEGQLSTMLYVLTAIVALAAVIALANSMVMSVIQRSGEIGLRRAIGARRAHISALVVTEAMTQGLLGGVAGVVLGTGALLAITIVNRWQPVLDPVVLPLALAGGLAVGAAAGLVAALRATTIQPALALRT